MTENNTFTILSLLIILLVASLFRVPGIYWGDSEITTNDFSYFHPDEGTHVSIAKYFIKKDTEIHKKYIMGFGFQIASLAIISQTFTHLPISEAQLYHLGRWLSLAYGLASIVLLYLIVRDLTQRRDVALLSASFLSLCSLSVTNSHFAVADAAGLFWIMLVCYLSYKAISRPSVSCHYLAWIAGGIAISIKLSICVTAPLLAMICFSPNRFRNLLFGFSLFILTIVLANGLSLGVPEIQGIWKDVFSGNLTVIPHHSTIETLSTIVISLAPAFSLPIVILAIFAMPHNIKIAKKNKRAFSCFALPVFLYFILLAMSDLPFERHLLPFAPIFCGLAAVSWQRMTQNRMLHQKVIWALPFISYLLFFVIDGELPFWQENRFQAAIWIENNIEPGSEVFSGQYAGSLLSRKKYKIVRRGITKEALTNNIDAIVLHEAHTYRYKRSRLSPFAPPSKDNIYHDQSFYLDYLPPLEEGKLPFTLSRTFPCPGQWALERSFYKKYWGTFTSFVGDIWIYQRVTSPKA